MWHKISRSTNLCPNMCVWCYIVYKIHSSWIHIRVNKHFGSFKNIYLDFRWILAIWRKNNVELMERTNKRKQKKPSREKGKHHKKMNTSGNEWGCLYGCVHVNVENRPNQKNAISKCYRSFCSYTVCFVANRDFFH